MMGEVEQSGQKMEQSWGGVCEMRWGRVERGVGWQIRPQEDQQHQSYNFQIPFPGLILLCKKSAK